MTTTISANQDQFIGIGAAIKRSGKSAQWIQLRAIKGAIRTRLVLGEKPFYSAADIQALIQTTA